MFSEARDAGSSKKALRVSADVRPATEAARTPAVAVQPESAGAQIVPEGTGETQTGLEGAGAQSVLEGAGAGTQTSFYVVEAADAAMTESSTRLGLF